MGKKSKDISHEQDGMDKHMSKKVKKKHMKPEGHKAKHHMGKPSRKMSSGGNANGHWIEHMHLKKGALHKQMGIAADKKIPEKKLEKAERSSNPLLKKRAQVAATLKGLPKA